jgi:hypothetical protein
MRLRSNHIVRLISLVAAIVSLVVMSTRLRADVGTCSGVTVTLPFSDVGGNPFFCQIAEAFFSGVDNGTSTSTFSPSQVVTRDQMAVSITRTLDESLSHASRRAALGEFWTGRSPSAIGRTAGLNQPAWVQSAPTSGSQIRVTELSRACGLAMALCSVRGQGPSELREYSRWGTRCLRPTTTTGICTR